MPNSTALAAEAQVVSHPRATTGRTKSSSTRRRHRRSVLLLVTWLIISVSMIAGATGVIATYF